MYVADTLTPMGVATCRLRELFWSWEGLASGCCRSMHRTGAHKNSFPVYKLTPVWVYWLGSKLTLGKGHLCCTLVKQPFHKHRVNPALQGGSRHTVLMQPFASPVEMVSFVCTSWLQNSQPWMWKCGMLSVIMMSCMCSFACLLPGMACQQVNSCGLLYNLTNP